MNVIEAITKKIQREGFSSNPHIKALVRLEKDFEGFEYLVVYTRNFNHHCYLLINIEKKKEKKFLRKEKDIYVIEINEESYVYKNESQPLSIDILRELRDLKDKKIELSQTSYFKFLTEKKDKERKVERKQEELSRLIKYLIEEEL